MKYVYEYEKPGIKPNQHTGGELKSNIEIRYRRDAGKENCFTCAMRFSFILSKFSH